MKKIYLQIFAICIIGLLISINITWQTTKPSNRVVLQPSDIVYIILVTSPRDGKPAKLKVEENDYALLAKSVNEGYAKIESANRSGSPLAWAPIGEIEINGKGYPWFAQGTEEILLKYLRCQLTSH